MDRDSQIRAMIMRQRNRNIPMQMMSNYVQQEQNIAQNMHEMHIRNSNNNNINNGNSNLYNNPNIQEMEKNITTNQIPNQMSSLYMPVNTNAANRVNSSMKNEYSSNIGSSSMLNRLNNNVQNSMNAGINNMSTGRINSKLSNSFNQRQAMPDTMAMKKNQPKLSNSPSSLYKMNMNYMMNNNSHSFEPQQIPLQQNIDGKVIHTQMKAIPPDVLNSRFNFQNREVMQKYQDQNNYKNMFDTSATIKQNAGMLPQMINYQNMQKPLMKYDNNYYSQHAMLAKQKTFDTNMQFNYQNSSPGVQYKMNLSNQQAQFKQHDQLNNYNAPQSGRMIGKSMFTNMYPVNNNQFIMYQKSGLAKTNDLYHDNSANPSSNYRNRYIGIGQNMMNNAPINNTKLNTAIPYKVLQSPENEKVLLTNNARNMVMQSNSNFSGMNQIYLDQNNKFGDQNQNDTKSTILSPIDNIQRLYNANNNEGNSNNLSVEVDDSNQQKRFISNSSKLMWDAPVPLRILAGISMHDNTQKSTKAWINLDSTSQFRFTRDNIMKGLESFSYIEGVLTGYTVYGGNTKLISNLLDKLNTLADISYKYIWKDECWRNFNNFNKNDYLTNNADKSSNEIWIRKYFEPSHLSNTYCVRAYHQQHIIAHSQLTCNMRLVQECSLTTTCIHIFRSIGFTECPTNMIFSKGIIYHIESGSDKHIIVTVSRLYTNNQLSNELFPNSIFVEAKLRSTDVDNIDFIASSLANFAKILEPFIILVKT